MKHRAFGNTGMNVTPIGFGGMRFDTSKPEEENRDLVLYAYEKGINYFDTAPGYCEDKSEIIFGKALRQMERDKYYVSTKFGPRVGVGAKEAYESVVKSVERFGTYIDIINAWCIIKEEDYARAMQEGGIVDGFKKAQAEGLVKHISFSTHMQKDVIAKYIKKGDFESVTLGLNATNYYLREEGAKAAKEMGMGVVAMNPLGGGLIPRNREALSYIGEEGEDIIHSALRFMVNYPYVDIAIVGFTEKEHVDAAVNAAADKTPYDKERMNIIAQHAGEYMHTVCTDCGYCSDCPQSIQIFKYLTTYNDKHAFGATDTQLVNSLTAALSRMPSAEGSTAADCIACGLCEDVCTQQLNIIERLAYMAKIEEMVHAK